MRVKAAKRGELPIFCQSSAEHCDRRVSETLIGKPGTRSARLPGGHECLIGFTPKVRI
jgi:hypothetical protein